MRQAPHFVVKERAVGEQVAFGTAVDGTHKRARAGHGESSQGCGPGTLGQAHSLEVALGLRHLGHALRAVRGKLKLHRLSSREREQQRDAPQHHCATRHAHAAAEGGRCDAEEPRDKLSAGAQVPRAECWESAAR